MVVSEVAGAGIDPHLVGEDDALQLKNVAVGRLEPRLWVAVPLSFLGLGAADLKVVRLFADREGLGGTSQARLLTGVTR